jgi:hypothetical protein
MPVNRDSQTQFQRGAAAAANESGSRAFLMSCDRKSESLFLGVDEI